MLTDEKNKKWFAVMAAVIVCFAFGPPKAGAGIAWLQKQKLTASDGAAEDWFGRSVCISGDYAIVGACYGDGNVANSGSVYIFRWDGTGWVQQQKLTASDGATSDSFGYSVSISGDYAIVGAIYDDDKGYNSGSAYIFKRNGESWSQQAKLLASDGAAEDYFGGSVSISGDYAIVGACWDDIYKGSAYIFKRDGTGWSQQQKLTASDGAAEDYFGCSVSISGDKIIVGAYGDNFSRGSAYIFKREGESWVPQQKLLASDGDDEDSFGISVSISGDYAIVGACQDTDKLEIWSGSAYIFKRNGETWSQQAKLLASDGAVADYFGCSVSISADLAIVGAWQYYSSGIGKAYIFRRDSTGWVQQQKLLASDGAVEDWFSYSVYISGDYAIIGAYADDDSGNNSGSAYIFEATATGELALLTPNGGEKLVAGSTYDITWDINGIIKNVFIEYSDNNGVDWKPIDTVANTGSYEWLVPKIDSNQYLVRINDADYPAAGDVSNDVFRIYVCTLTHDYNHDCFVGFFDFSHFATEWLRCGDPCDPSCQQ
ncbi:MAG: FG-GAP repeat protein [Sedimentisphaerales bacterium]|nr:FG-GAP repeat protein [Sedimentisphaerales bacterium]